MKNLFLIFVLVSFSASVASAAINAREGDNYSGWIVTKAATGTLNTSGGWVTGSSYDGSATNGSTTKSFANSDYYGLATGHFSILFLGGGAASWSSYTPPAPSSYTLTVTKNPTTANATVSGGGTFSANSTATVTASAGSGWQFDGFTGASANGTVIMTGNITVVCNFSQTTATGNATLGGFSSIAYDLKKDTNGDGVPDTVVSSGVIDDAHPFYMLDSIGSAAWELVATSGQVGEQNVPLNEVISSGSGIPSGGVAPAASVTYTPGESLQNVVVAPDGTVSKGTVATGSLSVNGGAPIQQYVYNSGGRSATYSYSSTGAASVTAADLRTATTQNSLENAQIVAAVKENTASTAARLDAITGNLTAINAAIAANGNAVVSALGTMSANMSNSSSNATLEKIADALTGNRSFSGGTLTAPSLGEGGNQITTKGADVTSLTSNATAMLGDISSSLRTGLPVAPELTAEYGNSDSFSFTLPVLGAVLVDWSPYLSVTNAFRDFLKFVLSVMSWIVLVKIFRGAFV